MRRVRVEIFQVKQVEWWQVRTKKIVQLKFTIALVIKAKAFSYLFLTRMNELEFSGFITSPMVSFLNIFLFSF